MHPDLQKSPQSFKLKPPESFICNMSADQKIRVFIVDDHKLIIEGLRASLETESDIEVAGHAQTGNACRAFFTANTADVVLMDINLPDANGIDLCKDVLAQSPKARIIALTTFNEREYISKMMNQGARGYILKNTEVEEIREAVRQVYKGHVFLSKEAGDTLYSSNAAETKSLPPLTPREVEILKLVADGMTAPEIAEKLFLSQLTVESHRRNIMAKVKARNIASLMKIAMDHNLI
jgi:DNA-binding NarL/FixJ family response regulator